MATRIPHVLESYLALPAECAQILLTSVLGASTNWLVLRYLYSYLRKPAATEEPSPTEDVRVVFVSFMRDFAFWKEGAGRLGLDLEGLGRSGKFVFVDGLSGLFSKDKAAQPAVKGRRVLRGAKLLDIQRQLEGAIVDVSAADAKTVLILDQPDLLVAASGEDLTGLAFRNMLLDVQEKVHATITTIAADEPLVAPQATTLEKEHASLVLGLAHAAEMVISLRLLDTGNASDVSGVLRITAGGDGNGERAVEETELLYFVGGDGSVKVFGRGQ
ncbi:elongator complex protein 6 [Colletotrichum spaethianum]|uniref:Elongator complex protein 6 n=1 Tax=Colletotrichum spaethianum TaxID=700344 RepID=A0AA37P7V9_9PEZI|nr:elongator complex protein 6 [Colletotrichum spaethianum]GKT45949.1 elongator complex protein 6 [Colletotrichum spaethianum]